MAAMNVQIRLASRPVRLRGDNIGKRLVKGV